MKHYNGSGVSSHPGDYYYGVYIDGKLYVNNNSTPFNVRGGGNGGMGSSGDCYGSIDGGMGSMVAMVGLGGLGGLIRGSMVGMVGMGGMGGMGGWGDCGSGSGNIYNIIVEVGSTPPEGIIQKMKKYARFGLEIFNDTQGGKIEQYVNFSDYVYTDNETHIEKLIDSIEKIGRAHV